MSRRLLLAGAAALALVVLAAGAAGYTYFFSGLRTTPKPLALATPTPGASASAAPAGSDVAGSWKVASGSQAEWRVTEVFAGTSLPHQAVGRTSGVTGSLTVEGSGASLSATNFSFTADLSQLASVDQVIGRDVSQRDQLVRRALSVSSNPDATFQSSQAVTLPAGFTDGQQVQLTVPGRLTIHGVTRDVSVTVTQLQLSGSQVQAAGTIQTTMSTFNIQPPSAPFVTVDQNVTIGFLITFAKA